MGLSPTVVPVAPPLYPLTGVPLNLPLLTTAAQFWKPSLELFRFGSVEFSPSLKEVSRMIGLPLSRDISLVPTGPVEIELFSVRPATFNLVADNEPPTLSLEQF
ncbi:hypothetical protein ACLOJK_024173, partial [Asimina triloba]